MSKHYLIQKVITVALVVVMSVCASVTASATAEKVQELAGLNDTIAVMQTLDVSDTKTERIMENFVLFAKDPTISITNFEKRKVYLKSTFPDVSEAMWSYEFIKDAYELGIMDGSNGKFNPRGTLTGAEAITIGSRIHAIYKYGNDENIRHFKADGQKWYECYVAYAKAEGLIGNELDSLLTVPITRAQMVRCWSKLLSEQDMKKQNTVIKLPDVSNSTSYYSDIIKFYEVGIIGGTDDVGSFQPDGNITREQCSTIFMRLVKSSLRTSGRTYSSEIQMIGDVAFNAQTDIAYDSSGNPVVSRAAQNRFIESLINSSNGVVVSNGGRSLDFDFNLIQLPEGYNWFISVDWGATKKISGVNMDDPGVMQNGHFVVSLSDAGYDPTYYTVTFTITDAKGHNAGQLAIGIDLNSIDGNFANYGKAYENDIPTNVDELTEQLFTVK